MADLFNAENFLLQSQAGVKWHIRANDAGGWDLGAEQDCTDIIEANKRSQNSGGKGYTKDKTFRKAATIPVVVQLEWLQKYGIDMNDPDHWPGVRRLLNSNEYRYLRPYEWQI